MKIKSPVLLVPLTDRRRPAYTVELRPSRISFDISSPTLYGYNKDCCDYALGITPTSYLTLSATWA